MKVKQGRIFTPSFYPNQQQYNSSSNYMSKFHLNGIFDFFSTSNNNFMRLGEWQKRSDVFVHKGRTNILMGLQKYVLLPKQLFV